jgi:hypothetical protein
MQLIAIRQKHKAYEEHRLRVFENRVLRRIFGPDRKWREAGEDCIIRNFIT